jgi:hypothetical protein
MGSAVRQLLLVNDVRLLQSWGVGIIAAMIKALARV